MKNFLEITVITLIVSLSVAITAYADDFVPEDEFSSTQSTSYTLDSGGSAADSINLQFGGSLNETIGWNVSNTRFDISDDVRIDGSLELGTIITFDAANTGSGNTIRIIANQGSDNDGEIRYNATTNQWEFSNDGGSFTAFGSGSGSSETSSTVIVDANRTQQTGIIYNTVADAVSYINTQTPSASNNFIIEMAPGTNTETFTVPTYTMLKGVHSSLSNFTGVITLGANSSAENIKTSSGGKLYVAGGNTAYLNNSDVVLGDGSGGLDGTISITRSFIDGQVDASGIALIYESLVGVTSFTNAGTIGTYNSSVFNLTDTGTWTNYGSAYDNAVLASGKRLTSTTTQGAIDELVEGSPANQITLNKDETGNPDQDVEIIAEQGTENNGILRYDDGNNRWEFSNDGTNFSALGGSTTGSSPPGSCSTGQSGKFWVDSDTGIMYVCDTSNNRNKWLSTHDNSLYGEDSDDCSSGKDTSSDRDCVISLGDDLGDDSTNIGFYMPHDFTVTGYGVSIDDNDCSSGTYDVEIRTGGNNDDDDETFSIKTDVATGLSDETENASNLNVDFDGDRYIIAGLDNNCKKSIHDYNLFIYYRWRHD